MVKRYFTLSLLLIVSIFILVSSGCSSGGKTYRVGVDPTWYPLDLMGKEANVFAFSNDILKEVSRLEGVYFKRVNMSWDNLLIGLKEGTYDGMLSSLHPYIYNLSSYDFSELMLHTGPVLVVRGEANIASMGQMVGKEIAVDSQTNEALLIQLYPDVIVRYYALIPQGLNDILAELIDGALINNIPATAFVQDLYEGRVKIASPPLNDAGLRMVTLQGENKELIDIFNRGLEKIRDKEFTISFLKNGTSSVLNNKDSARLH